MISIRNLVKVYPGPVAALQGVSLEIPSGMFGLLGPNGAGKTTLMRVLAGVLEPTSGEVWIDGQDALANPQRLWQSLGYLPQDFGFFPHLSGQKMLEYLLEVKGASAPGGVSKLASELLERVNLSYAAGRKVKEYSGGMRQRLGIAQAIAGNPSLIIVDEPTAGLDPEERLRFYRILAELAEKRTVILSTHIVDDVAVLCPRFAIIRGGKVVALTSPREARQALEGKVFEGAVGAEAAQTLGQSYRVLQSVLVEGENHLRIYSADGQAPQGFSRVAASLEDAYLLEMRDQPKSAAQGVA